MVSHSHLLSLHAVCRKLVTAAELVCSMPEWQGYVDVACPHVLYANEDPMCQHPIYLANTFWPDPPVMKEMRNYDVVCVESFVLRVSAL